MTPRKMATFRIDDELLDAMRAYYDAEGVQVSEQVRRGIVMWLESKGIDIKKTDRKRVSARKRP